jgi:lactoylglutathione lyase
MNWKLITALWMREVGVLRDFYITYFDAKSNVLYHIKKTEVKSYFLSFDEETRLKLMGHSDIAE